MWLIIYCCLFVFILHFLRTGLCSRFFIISIAQFIWSFSHFKFSSFNPNNVEIGSRPELCVLSFWALETCILLQLFMLQKISRTLNRFLIKSHVESSQVVEKLEYGRENIYFAIICAACNEFRWSSWRILLYTRDSIKKRDQCYQEYEYSYDGQSWQEGTENTTVIINCVQIWDNSVAFQISFFLEDFFFNYIIFFKYATCYYVVCISDF